VCRWIQSKTLNSSLKIRIKYCLYISVETVVGHSQVGVIAYLIRLHTNVSIRETQISSCFTDVEMVLIAFYECTAL